MKVCTWFLLFTIFGYTHTAEHENPQQNPKTVNLALETVLEFREKDKVADLKFLDNVQNLISKVKTVIDKNSKSLRRDFKTVEVVTFTEFIQDVVQILNTYEEKAFKEFFNILDDEARKYHYRGCKFHELLDNLETRKFLASKLDLAKNKPVSVIKTNINVLAEMLKNEVYDDKVKELVDYINSFYSKEAEPMFQKLYSDLERHSKSTKKDHNDMVKVIKEGLRSTIFDHFSRLPANARIELKNKIESFWKPIKVSSTITTKKFVNIKPDIIFAEEEKPINSKKEVKMTTAKKVEIKKETTKNFDRITIKDSDYKKRIIMRDGLNDDKKGYKYTKASHIHIPFDDKVVSTPTIKTKNDPEQQAKHKISDESSIEFSSSGQRLSERSFESNSIEFSQELQREFNTKPYMTLYPEAITFRPVTKKKNNKKIVQRAGEVNTEKHRYQTLWIEESTGKIPKSVLHKLATKHKAANKTKSKISHKYKRKKTHGSRYKKRTDGSESVFENKGLHGKSKFKHEKKKLRHTKHINIIKHGQKHEVKHKKKVERHRRPKYHEKPKPTERKPEKNVKSTTWISKEYFEQDGIKAMKEELFNFKKMMGPVTVEYKPEMTKRLKTNTIGIDKKITRKNPPLPRRNRLKTKESVYKSKIPPRVIVEREYEPLQKATIFTRKPTKNLVKTPAPKARRHGLTPGKHYRKSPSKLSDDGSVKEFINNWQAKEESQRKSNVEKDPSLLKRINELEKELRDVKNKLSNVTVEFTVETTEKNAVNVTHKDEKPDLRSQDEFGPYVPVVKKDGIKLTEIVDKKLYETEFKTVKDKETVFKKDFYINNQTKQEVTAHENKTDIDPKMFANSKGKMEVDQHFTEAQNYDSLRDLIIHNDNEEDSWKEAFTFDKIKATKSTTSVITKPKINTTNSTITVKPATLATPIKSSTILNATPFIILHDVKKDVVTLGNKIKNVPITTLPTHNFSAGILPSNQTLSSNATIHILVNKKEILNNTTTEFGLTFYRTLETTTNKEDESTPYGFYRRMEERFMQDLPDLDNGDMLNNYVVK